MVIRIHLRYLSLEVSLTVNTFLGLAGTSDGYYLLGDKTYGTFALVPEVFVILFLLWLFPLAELSLPLFIVVVFISLASFVLRPIVIVYISL